MAAYTDQQIDDLEKHLADVCVRAHNTMARYVTYQYATDEGRSFGKFGFGRRLSMMRKSADLIFDVLPPELEGIPDEERLDRAAIYLQAATLHAYGCTDCIAWVWTHEKNVRCDDGSILRKGDVGLHKSKFLRKRLPDGLKKYLSNDIDLWFESLKDVRDALMHRIPLYIPPHFVSPDRIPAHNALSRQIEDAMRQHDYMAVDRLNAEQALLHHYLPLAIHTVSVEAPYTHARIHELVLNYLFTCSVVAEKFMDELERGQMAKGISSAGNE